MINPHNPEFITKRPWYLGGGDAGPSLDHQADQRAEEDKVELSLTSADALLKNERERLRSDRKRGRLRLGMWVEALRKGRRPYRICQITKVGRNGTEFDLKYDDDGFVEKGIRFDRKKFERSRGEMGDPLIRLTKAGARSFEVDHVTFGKETYDSKRDGYHGYDVEAGYMGRMEEKFKRRDDLRKKRREKKARKTEQEEDGAGNGAGGHEGEDTPPRSDSDSDSDADSDAGSGSSDDEFVQRDADAKIHVTRLARQGGVGGAQMKVTARNLRIREDTAKYLRNLDPDSAYYDPKSRSMRENPNPDIEGDEAAFAGDNFARISGDAVGLAETQTFAWDADTRSGGQVRIHPQADPSRAELLKKQFKGKKEDLKKKRRDAVLDKYGGQEYLDGRGGLGEKSGDGRGTAGEADGEAGRAAEERRVRFGVSLKEDHYTRDGRIARDGGGAFASRRVALTSKYEEGVYTNGHTAVWGSFFHKGAFQWGYGDDHSLMRNSFATGLRGREANDESNELRFGTGEAGSAALAQARQMGRALLVSKGDQSLTSLRPPNSSGLYGEANQKATYDKEKLETALKKVDADAAKAADDRKRKYNSVDAEVDVTEEEMEAFRMRKERGDDPMARLGENKLLDYKK